MNRRSGNDEPSDGHELLQEFCLRFESYKTTPISNADFLIAQRLAEKLRKYYMLVEEADGITLANGKNKNRSEWQKSTLFNELGIQKKPGDTALINRGFEHLMGDENVQLAHKVLKRKRGETIPEATKRIAKTIIKKRNKNALEPAGWEVGLEADIVFGIYKEYKQHAIKLDLHFDEIGVPKCNEEEDIGGD